LFVAGTPSLYENREKVVSFIDNFTPRMNMEL